MILLHDIRKAVVLVPRCGSTSMLKALDGEVIGRHIPAMPYEDYELLGVCRHPLERLSSCYNFLSRGMEYRPPRGPFRRYDTASEWIVKERGYFPFATKAITQEQWLKPELGTKIFTSPVDLCKYLGVDHIPVLNKSRRKREFSLTDEAKAVLLEDFQWELEYHGVTL